ncbi:hypothetical protein D918_09192 [Trichuris suis]|nr:hypothetical protein D918_09192 [Trichuris suis]
MGYELVIAMKTTCDASCTHPFDKWNVNDPCKYKMSCDCIAPFSLGESWDFEERTNRNVLQSCHICSGNALPIRKGCVGFKSVLVASLIDVFAFLGTPKMGGGGGGEFFSRGQLQKERTLGAIFKSPVFELLVKASTKLGARRFASFEAALSLAIQLSVN